MKNIKRGVILGIVLLVLLATSISVFAAPGISITDDGITIGTSDEPGEIADSIKLMLILTVLSLLPSILIMMTSFTRIIIVLSFLRNAMGTQQMPPNQVLVGLALFMTLFVMSPVLTDLNDNALQPFIEEEINMDQAFDQASDTMKGFMLKNTRNKDITMFANLSKTPIVDDINDLPLKVVIPSFMISEISTAFKIGFVLFLPFLVIDMVVASTLMSMGMMMLPPVMISLPFKILLFLVVDGWNLIAGILINSFN